MRKLFADLSAYQMGVFQTFHKGEQERQAQYVFILLFLCLFHIVVFFHGATNTTYSCFGSCFLVIDLFHQKGAILFQGSLHHFLWNQLTLVFSNHCRTQ